MQTTRTTRTPEALFDLWGHVNGTQSRPSGNTLLRFVDDIESAEHPLRDRTRTEAAATLFGPNSAAAFTVDVTTLVPAAAALPSAPDSRQGWQLGLRFLFALAAREVPVARSRTSRLALTAAEAEALWVGINGTRAPLPGADLVAYIDVLLEEGARVAGHRFGDATRAQHVLAATGALGETDRTLAVYHLFSKAEQGGTLRTYLDFADVALDYVERIVWHDSLVTIPQAGTVPLRELTLTARS